MWRERPVAVTTTGSTRKARNARILPPLAATSEGRRTRSATSAMVTAVTKATGQKPCARDAIAVSLLLGLLEPVDQGRELGVRPLPLLAVLLAVDRLFLLEELGEERLVVLGGRRRQVGAGHLLRLGRALDAGRRDRVAEVALLAEEDGLAVRRRGGRRGGGAVARAEEGHREEGHEEEERDAHSLSDSHGLSFRRSNILRSWGIVRAGPGGPTYPTARFSFLFLAYPNG